jgi:D-lactate dehydrogenase (cytochrome)
VARLDAATRSDRLPALEQELRQLLGGDQISTGPSVLALHGEDLSFHAPCLPDIVVYPGRTGDVAAVLEIALRHEFPVVPFGAGSSLDGHVVPVRGGIALDLTRMDRILEVRPQDMLVRVEAGVTRGTLDKALGQHGLFFPVDPGADATLGGMAATNAAGTMTLRYGKMRTQVLGLEAVLPGGRVIRTGTAAAKSSAGYDMTGLLVGSEGTLAVITELLLRVQGIPEDVAVLRASFPDVEGACRLAGAVVSSGLLAQRIEFIDAWEVQAVNHFAGTDFPASPMVFVELAGAPAAVEADVDALRWLVGECAGSAVQVERDPTERSRLWRARHDLFFAEKSMAPGKEVASTDVCVPVGELAGAVAAHQLALRDLGLMGGVSAHAGDGNVHAAVLFDPGHPGEIDRVHEFGERLVIDALARGGTCSGEHGIGLGKREALEREHGDLIGLMTGVKELFDPLGIMNPGKLLPDVHR